MTVFLLICSLLAALFFQALHLPAAWLFGPLLVSVFFAVRNWKAVTFSKSPFCLIQAVIGTSLGAGFSKNTLHMLLSHLDIVAASVILIFCASLLNGWILARSTRLDTPTAFLGTMPGGAAAMMGMAESLQADVRLVAVMQYVRLLLILSTVFIAAPVLLHLFPHVSQTTSSILGHTTISPAWQRLGILALLTAAGYLAGMCTPRFPRVPTSCRHYWNLH